ncbi:MAG: phosphate/phosphite/phosphonate ABC transporter substrate-binding protein [Desulfobacterales bacterium]|nr:phosphate/phosphite/phosphonate ABC transporter substrate-binding protein [Desulfobacterales bacterium]
MRVKELLIFILMSLFLMSTQSYADEEIIFSATPCRPSNEMARIFQPLVDYVQKECGVKASYVAVDKYGELEQKMKEKLIHIGSFTTNAYVQAKAYFPEIRYMLSGLSKEGDLIRDSYHGVIVTLNTSDIYTLQDLKGKKFGFTDVSSSSGYKFPRQEFINAGIQPDDSFFKIFFLGKHNKVTDALAAKVIDGAATWDVNMVEAKAKHGDIFRVIVQTKPIPVSALAAAPHLSDETFQKIKQCIMKLKQDDEALEKFREYGGYYYGWSERDDSFYDPARLVLGIIK